jgi:hypothetical protein
MIKKLSDQIRRISTGPRVVAALAVMVLFLALVLPRQSGAAAEATGSSRSPDTSIGGSPAELYQLAEEYGEAGRQAYIRARWSFDLVFPLVYMAFLATGISWFSRHIPKMHGAWKLANLLPVLGGLFDYLENTTASLLMGLYPTRLAGLPELLIGTNLLKWLLIGLSFLIYAGFGAGALVTWIKARKAS